MLSDKGIIPGIKVDKGLVPIIEPEILPSMVTSRRCLRSMSVKQENL
ncbi:hypothetical protein [Desulfobacula sp.]|nr:hypothetical protein [Desulfobacula sp.]